MKRFLLPALSLALGLSAFALARQDPPPAPAPAAKPAKEKAKVYDETADGAQQIATALAKAKFAHKRVLIQWGANWCGWCLKLHALYRSDKDIAHELLYEYEPVFVDIGQWDKHLDLTAKYQVDLKAHGVPYLTVLDEDGKLVVNQGSDELEVKDSDHHDPAKVLSFLQKNQAPQTKADELLAAALERAKSEKKPLFLHFSTPWCHWCRELEAWMREPAVAPLFEREFVDLMLDAERYAGTTEILKRYTAEQPGWPWTVILDGEGHALADSYAAKAQNIGFPASEAEIAHFLEMLKKSGAHLSAAELESVRTSLVERRERSKQQAGR
ncbi:MAG: DUF255 domain-containing protein [Planctomycetes bacterium]|nr:DUF255 domain-containing protein [Planctomycetota bacterium]